MTRKAQVIRINNAVVRLATIAAGIDYNDIMHHSDEVRDADTGKLQGYQAFLFKVSDVSMEQYHQVANELLGIYANSVEIDDWQKVKDSNSLYLHIMIRL